VLYAVERIVKAGSVVSEGNYYDHH
jgi:hypothetical protein